MKRCPYDCNTCPYAQIGSKVKAARSNYIHKIVGHVDCQTDNLVYCISCNKCEEQYVGETEKTLAVRFSQHRGYARNGKLDKATGHHFNLPGHSLANMKVTTSQSHYRVVKLNLIFVNFARLRHVINKKYEAYVILYSHKIFQPNPRTCARA